MFSKINMLWLQFLIIFTIFSLNSVLADTAEKISFKVKVDSSLIGENQRLSGRLLIFMTHDLSPLKSIRPSFMDPDMVYIAAMEVSNLDKNKSVQLDPDLLFYPKPFSDAPAGEYQVMALLDQNHSYTYYGMDENDIYSDVVQILIPSSEIEVTLNKVVPERTANIPKNVRVIEFESAKLSAFWGRSIKMQASVVLPPSYDEKTSQKYPVVYHVHGFGGDHLRLYEIPSMMEQMRQKKRPEMIYVYLNANCSFGHHVFANSANNGPWGDALTEEFIPYLEKEFSMDAIESGRFLTGHSSGGWSTLWLMVNYPDFFGGVWSTAPDPVDFRHFTGPNLTQSPPQNMYQNDNGESYNLVRHNGQNIMSLEQYSKQEKVLGYFGGQMASFDAVFSPKGIDGQPMPIFCRETGIIDPFVQKAWEKYDISRILRDNWNTLGPKLKGKMHIIIGTEDTFHLEKAVYLLEAELKKLGSDAQITFIPKRNHFNLFHDNSFGKSLGNYIADEMYKVARPNEED